MPGRTILTLSAILLFIVGAVSLFGPDEVAARSGDVDAHGFVLALQIAGGALLGFAILNWMSRRNRIGGIYGRPLAIGNLLLFFSSAMTLGRAVWSGLFLPATIALCVLSAAMAAAFAWLAFVHDGID